MNESASAPFFNPDHFVPSRRQALEREPLDLKKIIRVAVPTEDPESAAEFEAVLGRLERSCRTFAMGPTSRNYVATLRITLDRARDDP